MKKKQQKKFLAIIAIIIMMVTSISKVFAYNTDFPDKSEREKEDNENKDKQIGIAVIEKEDVKDINSYYYLYYDSEGEVHIVEYIQNPIRTQWDENAKEKKKWILKSDADNIKAKELGAKEFYSDEDEIKKSENKEATDLYKKILETTQQKKSLYDYIEGSTEDEEPYTIESILFNKVPIFDVNFFSDKAAGKEIKSDSVVGIIRKMIATWYVTFRNIAFISLAFLIVYYGIRLAISSVASERANYKRMLIGWIKSIIIVLMIHYVMYIVIHFNETFINIIVNRNDNEVSIYNTIKTRALEGPLKVAVPATILYFILLFMWIRFIIAYFKRSFAVAFLVILAPLVGIRYSIESASGKGSQIVTEWTQRFITSVFIQSIHALIYVVFVETALDTALEDLNGFFIALFFLNFILAADKIFISIFKFQFRESTADRIRKPFSPVKDLVEWKAGYEIGKGIFEAGKDVAIDVKDGTIYTLNRGYLSAMDALDDRSGGNHRREIEDKLTAIPDFFDDKIRDVIVGNEVDENGRPIEIGKTRSNINKYLKVRKLSRKRGIEGAKAKRALRKQKNVIKKTFLSEFKIMRDLGSGVAGTVLAIPLIVSSDHPEEEIAAAMEIPTVFMSSTRNIRKVKNISRKANKEFDKTVKNINHVNKKMDRIEKELDKISGEDRKKAIDELKSISRTSANSNSIQIAINNYLEKNNVREIDEDELDFIISDVVDSMQGDLSDEERERIKKEAKAIIIDNSQKEKNRYEEDEQKEDGEPKKVSTKSNTGTSESSTNFTDKKAAEDEIDETEPYYTEFKQGEVTIEDVETDKENKDESQSDNMKDNGTKQSDSDEIENNTTEKVRNETYSFGEIVEGIEEAVIREKTSNKFTANLAEEINSIKDINERNTRRQGERSIADTNKFLDNL